MTAFASSLKATAERRRETEDDAIAGLKRAQDDYKAARTGYRTRQRQILQDVFKHVTDLIQDDEACDKFMKQTRRRTGTRTTLTWRRMETKTRTLRWGMSKKGQTLIRRFGSASRTS